MTTRTVPVPLLQAETILKQSDLSGLLSECLLWAKHVRKGGLGKALMACRLRHLQ
jgi:hypothetical protein